MIVTNLRLPAAALGAVIAGLAAVAAPQDPPPKAAKDFEQLVAAIDPGAFSPHLLATLTLTPDGKCVYEIVGYPARGTIPAWPAAKRTHTLPPDQQRRIAAALTATDWLGKAAEKGPLQLHQAKYALTLRRGGEVFRLGCEGEPAPYRELLRLLYGLSAQEFLAYQMEDVPGRAAHARSLLDSYVRAALGEPYGPPPDHFDFARFGGWAARAVRAPADRTPDDVATAARLLGLIRAAPEREALAALTRHDDVYVREAAQAALRRLPEPK